MEDKNNGLSTTLSEKQSEFLKENFKKMSEQELFQKIQEIGPKTDEKTFAEGFHAVASKLEATVFGQEVSESELASVAGGLCGFNGSDECRDPQYQYRVNHCTYQYARDIYEDKFPNCAATVEDSSWCGSNDACYSLVVQYENMRNCKKAWE